MHLPYIPPIVYEIAFAVVVVVTLSKILFALWRIEIVLARIADTVAPEEVDDVMRYAKTIYPTLEE